MLKIFAARRNRWVAGVAACGMPILLLLVALIVSSTAFAQTTGSISGVVKDPSGALVPGASVTLVNVKSKARRVTKSNGEGLFDIQAIQPSTYDLLFAAPGFESLKIAGIEINPGDSKTVPNITMKLGKYTEEVTVSASTAGVSLDSPEKSSLITADDIERLSTVGRDATELIRILPGFAVSTGGSLANGSTNVGSQTFGFSSSSVSSFSANGATPQTGATSVVSDGANVMDPGDMGASIENVNMDTVQEIKVQTADFGADSAKGPVVINAVGKSGGSNYHGAAYLYARDGNWNANDWLNNFDNVGRPAARYLYPGGEIGGPIKIPGTNFNHANKLTFFTQFEYYDQTKFDQLLQSFIPTQRMLSGDLTPASLAAALNVGASDITTQCPNFYTSGLLTNSGGICYSPGLGGGTFTQQNQSIEAGTVEGTGNGLLPVDPRALIYAKYWPNPNRTPQATGGLLSDGYNYVKALTSTHNGYSYHARVDENISDNTKLYVTYNLEYINDETPVDNTYYAGSDAIPYPTPDFSHTRSNALSINFTHVFSSSLTNELVAAGVYYYQPSQLADRNSVQDAATGWTGGRYYNNGALQLPGLVDYEEGVPDFAMGYFPASSAYLRKFSYNGGDNVTKQYKAHTLKAGVYAELTANNQIPYNYTQGENSFNHYENPCIVNADAYGANPVNTSNQSQLHNNVANFLQGCTGFSQSNSSPAADLHFRTIDFYVTDEWKVSSKLTLTLGIRFDHLGPWYDPSGLGLAVWNAPEQHVIYPVTSSTPPSQYPGISWHQTNSSVPLSGQESRALFYSPRAGLAYDLYGNGKTVFRGGWGAYRFHDSYNDSAGALATTLGVQNYLGPSNISCTYDQIAYQGSYDSGAVSAAPTPGQGCPQSSAGSIAPFDIYALNQHDSQQPVTYNYNLTLDQAMPFHSTIELSYVGNQSAHTFTEGPLSNLNYIPLGSLFQPDPITGVVSQPGTTQSVVADYRPYPNYDHVYVPNHIGYGNYNGLQLSWNKQRGAFIFGTNFTWSKALGIRGDYRTGAVGDPSNLRNNYGYLGFNRKYIGNFTYSYQVGKAYHGNHLAAALINDWELSGITGIQSGPDVAVVNTYSSNFGLSGGVQYTPPGSTEPVMVNISNTTILGTPDISLQPVVTCDPKSNLGGSSAFGKHYINGNCFALPQLGSNGQFELPDIHGPAYFNSDLFLQRTFPIKDKQNLQLRVSGFNFLNHPLPQFYGGSAPVALGLGFGDPTGQTFTTPQAAFAAAVQNTANFGYTPYKGGYRILETSLRYNF